MIFISFGFYSCTSSHFVLLKSNGTAQIDTDIDPEFNLIEKIKTSNIITDFDSANYRIQFTINNIDSIGNYMPFHKSGYLNFQDMNDSISVSTGNTKPYDTKHWSCCHLLIRIRTEEPMDAFKQNGKKIRKKKSKKNGGIFLSQTMRQQLKGKKQINVVLKKSSN
jgi:hypothetical protein